MAHNNLTLRGADERLQVAGVTWVQWLTLMAPCMLVASLLRDVLRLWIILVVGMPWLLCWALADVRMDRHLANGRGFAHRRFRLGVGRWLYGRLGWAWLGSWERPFAPLVTLSGDGDMLQTPAGPVQVIAVDLLSLDAYTPEQQDALCAGLERVARTRRPGQVVQFLVVARALDGESVVREIASRVNAPVTPALTAMRQSDLAELAQQMRLRFTAQLDGYVVVGPPPRTAFSDLDAASALRRATATVRTQVTAMGLGTRLLTGDALRALLAEQPTVAAERLRSVTLADGRVAATVALLLPDERTNPGDLVPLLGDLACEYRLAIHVTGLDRTGEARRFKLRRNIEGDDEAGNAEHGRALVRSRRAGVVRWGFYLTLLAADEAALRQAVGQAMEILHVDLNASVARLLGHQAPGYGATLPTGYDTARRGWRIDTATIGNYVPFLRFNPGTVGGIPLGYAGNQLVRLQPDDPDHRNSIVTIYGVTGSGKTVAGLKLLKWALYSGARGTILERTGDPEKGIPSHYATLCRIAGGTMVYLGAVRPLTINIWDGTPAHVVGAHEMMLGQPGADVDPIRRSLLAEGVRWVKGEYGPAALEEHFHAWLVRAAQEESRPDYLRRHLQEMAAMLEPFVGQGDYAPLFNRPTTVPLDASLLVFNTLGVPEHLDPLVMYVVSDAIARRGRRPGEAPPITILDEGWKVAEHAAGARAIAEWGRRGRHTAMYLVFLTQAVRDLRNNPRAWPLFEGASIAILMRLVDAKGEAASELADAYGLTATERETVMGLQRVRDEQTLAGHAEAFLIRQSATHTHSIRGTVEIPATPDEAIVFASDPLDVVWLRERLIAQEGDPWRGCQATRAVRARGVICDEPVPLEADTLEEVVV